MFEDGEPDVPTKDEKKPTNKMPKWVVNVLRIIFGFRRSQRQRSPEIPFVGPITTGPPPVSKIIPDVAAIPLDISFTASESKGLIDPLTSIIEALGNALSAAKVRS